MKDLVRQKTALGEEIEKILNDQIRQEAKASATYLAMASWCDQHGFAHSTDFFYKQSGEERGHMLKIFKYVNDVGGKAISPEVTDIPNNFNSLRAIFEQALELIARRALELFDVIGEEGVGIYMIDKKIPEIQYKAE